MQGQGAVHFAIRKNPREDIKSGLSKEFGIQGNKPMPITVAELNFDLAEYFATVGLQDTAFLSSHGIQDYRMAVNFDIAQRDFQLAIGGLFSSGRTRKAVVAKKYAQRFNQEVGRCVLGLCWAQCCPY